MDRKRRLSHRLRENWKPKFKNIAGTAEDLEDDDDFVSPPKEYNRMMIFKTYLKLYIGNHDLKSNFTNIGLVFFPILDKEKQHAQRQTH
ncbi:hypothetical protein L1887_12836 [Cichorium endivia]|nr:hypothetical protein L1887_12836 [Cichorium endivia]